MQFIWIPCRFKMAPPISLSPSVTNVRLHAAPRQSVMRPRCGTPLAGDNLLSPVRGGRTTEGGEGCGQTMTSTRRFPHARFTRQTWHISGTYWAARLSQWYVVYMAGMIHRYMVTAMVIFMERKRGGVSTPITATLHAKCCR